MIGLKSCKIYPGDIVTIDDVLVWYDYDSPTSQCLIVSVEELESGERYDCSGYVRITFLNNDKLHSMIIAIVALNQYPVITTCQARS